MSKPLINTYTHKNHTFLKRFKFVLYLWTQIKVKQMWNKSKADVKSAYLHSRDFVMSIGEKKKESKNLHPATFCDQIF